MKVSRFSSFKSVFIETEGFRKRPPVLSSLSILSEMETLVYILDGHIKIGLAQKDIVHGSQLLCPLHLHNVQYTGRGCWPCIACL